MAGRPWSPRNLGSSLPAGPCGRAPGTILRLDRPAPSEPPGAAVFGGDGPLSDGATVFVDPNISVFLNESATVFDPTSGTLV